MSRMNFPFFFTNQPKTDFHIICAQEDNLTTVLDEELQALALKYTFRGQEGKHFLHQTKDKTQLVIGCGKNLLKTGLAIFHLLKDFPPVAAISIICNHLTKEAIQDLVTGIKLQAYEFLQYKTVHEKDYQKRMHSFYIVTELSVADAIQEYDDVIEGVMFTKDLSNEPANILYPEVLAQRIKAKLKGLPVTIKVLDEKEMEELGMGGILAVGQGSRKPPRMIALEYRGGRQGDAPLAFVGKAVTFDSGGVSIKPSQSMEDMKHDMSGGATVAGLFYALASRKAKINAIGVIGAAENMPDGNAYRPSDIVKTASGKTIEIFNTDAEGRVILADALWYAANYKPRFIVDLATLTGAITVTLGNVYAGIFTESDTLAEKLTTAGDAVGEPLWRLPLHPRFTKAITSKIADTRNTSSEKGAGSCTAAAFLREFVPKEIDWCHMDIAGVAYGMLSEHISKEGASGFGVRLLDEFVKGYEV